MTNSLTKPHILVVEDEAAIRDTTVFVLETEGFTVTAAANTDEALTALEHIAIRSKRIDLILIDFDMPASNTKAMIAELQRRGILIPTLAFTGLINDAMVREIGKSGALHLLVKPITPNVLVAAINKIFALDRSSAATTTTFHNTKGHTQ